MLKKIIASVLVLGLCVAPVGHVFDQSAHVASAKSYKSGKRSYSPSTNNSPSLNKSDQQVKKQNETTNFTKKTAPQKAKKGGFLKGLFVGGMAGLLFGSLLANLGALGSILGLIINIITIVAVIMVIRKIVSFIKNKRREYQRW